MGSVPPPTQSALSRILEMIQALTCATADRLFSLAESMIAAVRRISQTQALHPKAERVVYAFLQALMAISKLTYDLEYSARAQLADAPKLAASDSALCLVCRICDSPIPAALFEEHTRTCVALYQSKAMIASVDEQFSHLRSEIGELFLQVPWPGPKAVGVTSLIPALQIYALCSWGLRLDPSVSDTVTELKWINVILGNWPEELYPELTPYVQEVTVAINEKIKISKALCDALAMIRRHGGETRPTLPSIADFSFIKRISRGATASVFLARKKKTGDIFVMKATPRRSLQQKNQAQRLLVEKDILLQFSHPNMVTFFYSIVAKNNLYLVTEFVPGGDLFSLLQNLGSLNENVAQFYAMELISVLRYLRENGVCHRDIKPDNLLISADGHLKLTDFGLSFLGMVDRASDGPTLRVAKSFVGTPDYLAPEIILNHPHSFSVDYWSLGILMYELVYGDPPFHQETEKETYRCALLGNLKFPTDVKVSPDFQDLVRRLLAVDPTQRIGHTSIDEIANHPWFMGIDPQAPPPFVPTLSSDLDTGYFEQRYAFNPDEDNSVMEDLRCEVSSGDIHTVDSFTSVSLGQLERRNNQMAKMSGVKSVPGTGLDTSSSLGDLSRQSKSKASKSVQDIAKRARGGGATALSIQRRRSVGSVAVQKPMALSPLVVAPAAKHDMNLE
jgi:serine/threonine protein kinase